MNGDILMFFDGHMEALPLYESLEARVLAAFPQARPVAHKTQISFYDRRMFACVSFLRARPKREMPDPSIVLTLGFPCAKTSPRIAARAEVRPGRWTHHIVLDGPPDREIMEWIAEAHAFAHRNVF